LICPLSNRRKESPVQLGAGVSLTPGFSTVLSERHWIQLFQQLSLVHYPMKPLKRLMVSH
jgi:hypothetical protein